MNTFYKGLAITFFLIGSIGLAPFAHAEEYNLSYGARLTEANGAPILGQDGKLDLEVSFYNSGSGGSPIGPSPISFPGTAVAEGVFQLSITLAPTEFHQVFQDPSTPVYIEVKDVKSGAVFPRQRFSVIPFALKTPIDNDTIVYNSDGKLTVGSNVGTVKQITAGSGLIGGTITDSGTITVDAGTTGNKIVQLSDGKLPSVDGSNLSSVNAEKLQTRNVSAAVPVSGQVLKWSGSAWVPSSDLVGETGSGEANTASNVTSGSGVGLFKAKVSADLQLYSLSPGAGMTINLVNDDVVIASTITQYTDAMAKATTVADSITDSITNVAPSQNAVFDALALKSATTHNHDTTYEPKGLSTDVVTNAKMADNSVGSAEIIDLSIGTGDIATGAITTAKIAACADTQILKMSGVNWVCSSDANSGGTVTSVASGTGLTGGPIAGTGTLSLATSGVTAGTYTKVTVDTYGRATSGTSIAAGDLPSSIDVAKIGSGAVGNTEFGYLDGVTSAIQTQLNGQVVGPTSATDNAIARFDGTTGKLVQNSGVVIDDSGNVGIGTTTPNANTALQIDSTTRGMAIPRMTTAQRKAISAPFEGLKAFDTDAHREMFYDGSRWLEVGSDPIGTIKAWHKNKGGTPSLPWGWQECNGTTVNDTESPYDGTAVPNLNSNTQDGSTNSGMFLRGGSTSGTMQADATAANSLVVQAKGLATIGPNWSIGQGEVDSNLASQSWTDYSQLLRVTGDVETRPANMSVVWIMRVK